MEYDPFKILKETLKLPPEARAAIAGFLLDSLDEFFDSEIEAGMNSSPIELKSVNAQGVYLTNDALTVYLDDGRSISVPIAWYPRLLHGTSNERADWRFIGVGSGIHWECLDEDISVENLLMGRPSIESQRSLKRWLESRASQSKPS